MRPALRLEDNKALQKANQRILAVRIVIDDSLPYHFQFKIGNCSRKNLIICVHVTRPYQTAEADHLCLLIERDLPLGLDHENAVRQYAYHLSANSSVQARIRDALPLRRQGTRRILREQVLQAVGGRKLCKE